MANEIKISLVKDGGEAADQSSFSERTIEEPINELATPVLGRITKYATVAALAKVAFDLAKKTYNRLNDIEKDNRVIEDSLRNYGGAGFSANTVGDRFNVFGKRIDGESVAYRR